MFRIGARFPIIRAICGCLSVCARRCNYFSLHPPWKFGYMAMHAKYKEDFTNSVNSKIHFPFFWPPSFAFTLPFVLFNISSSVSVIYYHLSNVHSYFKCLTYVVHLYVIHMCFRVACLWDQNGIMIDSYKICQGALLGLFLFYVAFRLHSLILRLDALFSFIKAHPNTNQSWLGGVLGKHTPTSTRAHPNRYQSTS